MERTDRRELLRLGLASAGVAFTANAAAGAAGAQEKREDEARPVKPGDALDRALERQHENPSSDVGFLSNHVPMCVEALDALGREDVIDAWMDGHFEAVRPDDVTVRAIGEDWRGALGDASRFHDWHARFADELDGAAWQDVVRVWAPRLVPGLSGVATHGVIRAAHAVRSITARDNAIRRKELAVALGYWASFYSELPWDKTASPRKTVAEALDAIEPRRARIPPPRGNIVAGLNSLQGWPPFAQAAGLVPLGDPVATLGDITAVFAGTYLRNPSHRVHFTHAVTAPSAVRLLAPHLDDESISHAVRYAWQAAAALYTVYHDPASKAPADRPSVPRGECIVQVVRNGSPHAIKLVEACFREHDTDPRDVRLQAAWDAARSLNG